MSIAALPHPSAEPSAAQARPGRALGTWIAVFVCAGAMYLLTAGRGAQWQDSGWQQYRITSGQIAHPHGLALTHPLQFHLGRLSIALTNLRPAFAITLVSVLAGALAVANVAAVATLLTGRWVVGVWAALALGLAHTFWKHATVTESYALVAATLSAEWLALALAARRADWRWWAAAALANGVGLSNHMLAILSTPCLAVLGVWLVRRGLLPGRWLALGALLWLAGAGPYLGLVAAEGWRSGDWAAVLRSATVGTYGEQAFNTSITVRLLVLTAGYFVYNFPGLTVLFAVRARPGPAGVPRVLFVLLVAQLLLYLTFAARYPIVDQYTFFVPVYVLATLLAAIGFERTLAACRTPSGRRSWTAAALLTAAWTPLVYLGAARLTAERGWLSAMVRNKPYRDGYRSFLIPWARGDDHADRLNEALAAAAEGDGLILSEDSMQSYGIRYGLAAGELPAGLTLVDARPIAGELPPAASDALAQALAAGRRVVLAPFDRDRPAIVPPAGRWERRGDVYLLSGAGP